MELELLVGLFIIYLFGIVAGIIFVNLLSKKVNGLKDSIYKISNLSKDNKYHTEEMYDRIKILECEHKNKSYCSGIYGIIHDYLDYTIECSDCKKTLEKFDNEKDWLKSKKTTLN